MRSRSDQHVTWRGTENPADPLALDVVLSNLTWQTPQEVLAALEAGDVALDKGDSQEKTESILRCIDWIFWRMKPESEMFSGDCSVRFVDG